jgi:hypothetical protein
MDRPMSASDPYRHEGLRPVRSQCAHRLAAGDEAGATSLDLTGGTVDVRCEPTLDGGVFLRALLHVKPRPRAGSTICRVGSAPFVWESPIETDRA